MFDSVVISLVYIINVFEGYKIFLDYSKFYKLAICSTDKGGQNVNAIITKTCGINVWQKN